MELLVTIRDKIATYAEMRPYVCGNSDYVIHFDMDEEWAAHETKTARFVKDDGTYHDQVFTGNDCPVPVISNTFSIRVGVFAGDLHTTTPAYIPAKKSILCGSGMPSAPSDDVYAQIMEHLNQIEQNGVSDAEIKAAIEAYLIENPIEGVTPEEVAAAIEKYMRDHPVLVEETDPTVPNWAKQPEKPTYTAQEVGAQPKGDYALKSEIPNVPVQSVNGKTGAVKLSAADVGALPEDTEIPAPYTLPTASADTLGGVKVGNGLQMYGDALEVKPEEYELIETITLEEEMALERTKEPDGTPYNFDVLALRIKKPAGITINESVGTTAETKKKKYLPLYFTETKKTDEQWAYAVAEKNRGRWLRRRSPAWDIYNSTLYPYEVIYPMFDSPAKDDAINRMFSSKVIPAGLIIEIWGVRADA